jgi:hypothetical protein
MAGLLCPAFFIMGSQIGEIKKELRKYGWVLTRNGTKHYVYEREGKTLLIPKGTKVFTRSYTRIMMTISGRYQANRPTDQLNLSGEF